MWLYFRLFLLAIQLLGRTRRDLLLENVVLRQQLAIYERVPRRPPLRTADRRFWSLLARHWHPWRHHLVVVRPATVVRWHRTAWRRSWRWQSRGRAPGRPAIEAETVALIRRLARENQTWGTRRIEGELRQLGLLVSRATIQRYCGPRRSPSSGWRTFLRLHAPEIWAADFFTVQTLPFRTVSVFFCLSHDRRRVIH